jgi:phospholipase/carboxylesterase
MVRPRIEPEAAVPPNLVSRRTFVASATAALVTLPRVDLFAHPTPAGIRLKSRPGKPKLTIAQGLHRCKLDTGARDSWINVPKSLDAKKPAPLLLALHGATQGHDVMINRLAAFSETTGAALLAPDSRGMSWDGIRGDFDVDVAFIDRALANGDLFSRMLAFSPGFVIPAERHGKPRIFVSHGRQDPILPIERCSRVLVPQLKREGYDVRFDEFEGGHRMPPEILTAAAEWLTSSR